MRPCRLTGRLPLTGDRGFTLIELLVVILVVGVLAGVALVTFSGASDDGHDSAAQQTVAVAYRHVRVEGTRVERFSNARELLERSLRALQRAEPGGSYTDYAGVLDDVAAATGASTGPGVVSVSAEDAETVTVCSRSERDMVFCLRTNFDGKLRRGTGSDGSVARSRAVDEADARCALPTVQDPPMGCGSARAGWGAGSADDRLDGPVVFVSDIDGNPELYRVNPDSTGLRRLTTSDATDVYPSWSPDRAQIVFRSDRSGNPDIFVIAAVGGDPRQITHDPGRDDQPDWHPHEDRIVFVSDRHGNSELYTMRSDGSDLRRLTHNAAVESSPRFSPDGRHIAFVSDRDGIRRVYVSSADGSDIHPVSPADISADTPTWSPSGDQIAYVAGAPGRLRVVDVDGGRDHEALAGVTVAEPAWSAAGDRIIFSRSDDVANSDLAIVDLDSDDVTAVTSGSGQDHFPDW